MDGAVTTSRGAPVAQRTSQQKTTLESARRSQPLSCPCYRETREYTVFFFIYDVDLMKTSVQQEKAFTSLVTNARLPLTRALTEDAGGTRYTTQPLLI